VSQLLTEQLDAASVLLDVVADVNVPGGYCGSQLGAAALGTGTKAVTFLLANSADLALRGSDYSPTQLTDIQSNCGLIGGLDLASLFGIGANGFELNAALSMAVTRPYKSGNGQRYPWPPKRYRSAAPGGADGQAMVTQARTTLPSTNIALLKLMTTFRSGA
jgi:hypothetical protein